MRILLRSISLMLGLATSLSAYSQSLTLDQLIYVNTLEGMSQDAYLTERGWKFEHVANQADSISYSYWRYYKSSNDPMGEVAVQRTKGKRDALVYSVAARRPFDDIREKVLDYHMEFLGSNNTEGVMRDFYRGRKYEVRLSLENEGGEPLYRVRVQQHGLVKGYSEDEDGKMIEQWFLPSPPTEKQKAQWRAFSDSLNQATKNPKAKRPRK
jgi:hypothetical protein